MDNRDLAPEQARAVMDVIGRQLAYMGRLRQRMNVTGFPPADPLYVAVERAYNALQELHVAAHYASCTGNIGRPAKRRPGGRPWND